jgi:hypothetical protein
MRLRVTLLALALLSLPAAASPRDELLRIVPEDYTFCVVAQNLRDQAKVGGDASFLPALAQSPLFKQLQQTPEAKKVQQVIETILKELDVTPARLRDDVLGDAFVFAYRKGPAGQPDAEDGIILLHARDEKLLSRLVDRLNEIQTRSGELKAVEPVDGKAGKFFRRAKAAAGEPADFYALRGHLLLFANREPMLGSMLAKLAEPQEAEPAILSRIKKLGVHESPVACLINPRAFDADLGENAKAMKASEQAFLKQFRRYWQAVDGLAVSLNFQPNLELGLAINVRKQDLPKEAAAFLTAAAKRSPLWDRIPADALIAAAGRFPPEATAAMLGSFLMPEDRQKVLEAIGDATRPFLESDDLAPLLRGIGPDFGFWIAAPGPSDKTWSPQGVFAAKIAPGPDGVRAEQAAIKGLDFVARLACLSNKGLRVHTEKQGAVTVQSVSHPGVFPPGFQPAFASKRGYIVIADSPRTISRFEAPTEEATDADEVPLIRISVSAWRNYLKQHRQEIGKFLATAKGVEPAAFDAQLDAVLPILEGLDQIEFVQRSAKDRVSFVVRFKNTPK